MTLSRMSADRERSYKVEQSMVAGRAVCAGMVFRTSNLDLFRPLELNRRVDPRRVDMLKKSIKEYGYLNSPILVNEKYEVIDGQGRLAACKELGCPITYMVVEGLTIDHCRALNMNAKNWTTEDFIISYAESGNENYERLIDLVPVKAHKQIRGMCFLLAVCSYCGARGTGAVEVNAGKLILSEETAARARQVYGFINEHTDEIFSVRGRGNMFARAIAFALACTDVDTDRLAKVLRERIYILEPVGDIKSAVEAVDKLYNFNLRTKSVEVARVWKEQAKARGKLK